LSKILRAGVAAVIAAATVPALITSVYAMLPEGRKAPDFKLSALGGKTMSLADLRKDPTDKAKKRVVLLDFWATWCPPCQEYAPKLQRLHERYGKQGLHIVGIALDSDGAKSVRPFVKQRKLTYTMLLDSERKVARLYQAPPIPQTYIVDREGVIRSLHLGFYPGMEKDLEKEIKALLK
jgi:peroxiredoxin